TYVTQLFFRGRLGQGWMDTDIANMEAYVVSTAQEGAVHPTNDVFEHITDARQRGKRVLDERLTYSKASLVLHMLNYLIGSDTAFYRAIREYETGPLRYGVAGAEDFRQSIERSSGLDLKWFIDEWI